MMPWNLDTYHAFLHSKRVVAQSAGVTIARDALPTRLFPFQRDIVAWALRKGRAALFADCGMGKSFMQLAWAQAIHKETGGDVLILTPLAVAGQTLAEGQKLGITVQICRSQTDVRPGLVVTNYEMLHRFDAHHFVGVVLDESSILKSYMGSTKRALVEAFAQTAYRLCCTATPAPNDVIEIGNHSEFLGIMPSNEMLMRWFTNDTMHNGRYRLKGYAQKPFWEWIASWAVSLRRPSDMGYPDDGFTLPDLQITRHYVETDVTVGAEDGHLFRAQALSATNLHKEMRLTAADRARVVAEIVNASHGFVTSTGNQRTQAACGRKKMQADDEQAGHCSQSTVGCVPSADRLRSGETRIEVSHLPVSLPRGEDSFAQAAPSESAHSTRILPSCGEPLPSSHHHRLEPWIIWCHTNYEQEELEKHFGERAFSVSGSLSSAEKERRIVGWLQGERPILISKPSICGYGLNFQHCHRTAFVGLSYSFEDFYQAVRRLYRFGQTQPVEVIIVAAQTEASLVVALERKMAAHMQMSEAMHASAQLSLREDLHLMQHDTFTSECGRDWTLYHGDCVAVTRSLTENSVDFSIFSPPFSGLYIYSDALEDMGNSATDEEFFRHFDFFLPELLRVTRPGRLCAVHCKDLVSYKSRDGAAGLRDFSGEIIRHFSAAGWQYHSKVTIWKDPVIEMQRTKAHGLLYKTLRADASSSRQGMPEYLLVFRKWPRSDEEEAQRMPVRHTKEDVPLELWQRYASPVWFDIRQTRVLNVEQARENQDEKHLCPLQLDVIERAIQLWSNPGEVVFSPFAGIGSEGYEALRLERRFVGIELKHAYILAARKNLERVLRERSQVSLFEALAERETPSPMPSEQVPFDLQVRA